MITDYPKNPLRIVAALATVLLAVTSASAINFEKEENIHISNLHRIDDDLFAWGSNITVDGVIEGDLVAGGYTINTNGHIRGSASVLGFKIHHTGKLDGALRGFVNFCEIDGYVGRSVVIMGNDLRVGERAAIEKEVIFRGGMAHFDGMAKGNVDIAAEKVYLSGIVGGDARLEGHSINITAPAVIKGNLVYVCKDSASLSLAPGVTILGETDWELPKEAAGADAGRGWFASSIISISCLLAAFIFGMILLSLFNKYAIEAANQLRNRTAVATATGLLMILIFAVSVVILFISAVFVIFGLTLIQGDSASLGLLVLALSVLMVPITSFMTVSGGVLFYSGKIVIALVGGYWVVRLFSPGATYLSRFQLFLGLAILSILFAIPYVGFLIYLVVSIIGAGAIVLGIKYCRREYAAAAPPSSHESGDKALPGAP